VAKDARGQDKMEEAVEVRGGRKKGESSQRGGLKERGGGGSGGK